MSNTKNVKITIALILSLIFFVLSKEETGLPFILCFGMSVFFFCMVIEAIRFFTEDDEKSLNMRIAELEAEVQKLKTAQQR